MNTAAQLIAQTRFKAKELVRREEYRVGSRMIAYDSVGSMIGASGAWVRKFVKGYLDVSISFPVGMNIVNSYERLCARIEFDADRRLENARAAGQSDIEMGESVDSRTARKAR